MLCALPCVCRGLDYAAAEGCIIAFGDLDLLISGGGGGGSGEFFSERREINNRRPPPQSIGISIAIATKNNTLRSLEKKTLPSPA